MLLAVFPFQCCSAAWILECSGAASFSCMQPAEEVRTQEIAMEVGRLASVEVVEVNHTLGPKSLKVGPMHVL